MGEDSRKILARVNHLEADQSSQDIYDDWSNDYDAHLVNDFGYVSPSVAARSLADEIDDMDISEGMLDQARKKQVYRGLMVGDLTARLALDQDCYDAGLCVGSMGAGHIGARHSAELLRPIRVGGLFIITINAMHYAPEGFEAVFKQMEIDGLWQIRRLSEFNYLTKLERPGMLLVAEKL